MRKRKWKEEVDSEDQSGQRNLTDQGQFSQPKSEQHLEGNSGCETTNHREPPLLDGTASVLVLLYAFVVDCVP
jgi:hypothetical protein